MKPNTNIIGAAGEYFVVYHLSLRGLVVGIPRAGSPGVDLLVTHPESLKQLTLQVKTAWHASKPNCHRRRYWEWPIRFPDKVVESNDHLYVFVDLDHRSGRNEFHTTCFIVPSATVKRYPYANSTRPSFKITLEDEDLYRDKWEMITTELV